MNFRKIVPFLALGVVLSLISPSVANGYNGNTLGLRWDDDARAGAMGLIPSTPCGGRTNGTLRSITLDDCSRSNCPLKLDKTYKGDVTVTLGASHRNGLMVSVNALGSKPKQLYYYTYNSNYSAGNTTTFNYNVKFSKNDYKKYLGNYTLQLEIKDQNSTEICHNFYVYLNSGIRAGLSILPLGILPFALLFRN